MLGVCSLVARCCFVDSFLLLLVVCCLLRVDCCLLLVVCCLLSVVGFLLFVVALCVVRCALCVLCRPWYVVLNSTIYIYYIRIQKVLFLRIVSKALCI